MKHLKPIVHSLRLVLVLALAACGITAPTSQRWTTTQNGKTPLMAAVEQGNLEQVRSLMTAGAKVNARCDATGLRTMTDRFASGSTSYSDSVPLKAKGNSALSLAVLNENVEITRYLVEQGADVNARVVYVNGGIQQTGQGMTTDDFQTVAQQEATILQLAQQRGNPEIIRIISDR